ncbi:helix-turn-helix transcriptional regulator [Candidatus Pacearchaeota archaeon]|nr:helix-turn-helix transcriptional regulator [Candidatus Pacearchaeota archaeon]
MRIYLKNKALHSQLIKKNLSQNWAAQKLGISTGYMSQLMRGGRNPSPGLRKRVMELFIESDFDDLFEIRED